MTKAELIEKMSADADIVKSAAAKTLEALIDGIEKTLKKGNKVALLGFGTFSLAERKARKGRNPRTGETISIKASKVPKFTAGKVFRDAIN
ncbi:MAG TPA: HU family DNA-binding protein [Thermodesulfovibrionales bacterium]|nr:HU family DNA-binding protein [Thermodesulfovibrionales bacterium]